MSMRYSLCIVLPTHNEARVLEKNVRAVHAFCVSAFSHYAWEICIADNGSRDATPAIAARLARELPHVRWFHTEISGRGGALRRAWGESSADILAYMDAVLATDLVALPLLVAAISHGADVAVGSRFISGALVERSWHRRCMSRVYNWMTRHLLHLRTRDAQCGFKAVSKKAAKILLPLIRNTQWFFDTELLVLAERRGMRIVEVPVSWVEARDRKRKSTVRIARTIVDYCREIWRVRRSITSR